MTLTLDDAGRPSAPEVVIPFEEGLTLAQPRWVGDRLLYSAQRPGGFRDLWIREAAPGATPRRLTDDRAHDMAPNLHPDGRTVLYVSDPEGIYDLYALDLETGDRFQVTRVMGSAINPSVSPDGRRVAYQGWHSAGNELYVMPLEAPPWSDSGATGRHAWTPVPPAPSEGPPDLEGPRYDPAPLAPDAATVGPYEPWRAIWPRAWAPTPGSRGWGHDVVVIREAAGGARTRLIHGQDYLVDLDPAGGLWLSLLGDPGADVVKLVGPAASCPSCGA